MASTNPIVKRCNASGASGAPSSDMLLRAHSGLPPVDLAPIRGAEKHLAWWSRPPTGDEYPLFAGAVGLMTHNGAVITTFATGYAVRYGGTNGEELPTEQQVPMRPDTVFDMASVTKLFTSIAVMQLVEQGEVRLTDPVARHLPEFGVPGKHAVTVQQLLTHTSGLEPSLPLWRDWPEQAARVNAALKAAPQAGSAGNYSYSDLNFIALGVLVERCSSSGLDTVLARQIIEPLGMTDTGFNPPGSMLGRIAATEYQSDPPRGMIRGQVHDENAYSLGGVAGHAGVFSTARDTAVLGQTLLNGGSYAGTRILRPDTVRIMFTNNNRRMSGPAQGLGLELARPRYMGALSTAGTGGHSGYTGTSVVIDPLSNSLAILLTNRVHPSRLWGSINPARRMWASALASALR